MYAVGGPQNPFGCPRAQQMAAAEVRAPQQPLAGGVPLSCSCVGAEWTPDTGTGPVLRPSRAQGPGRALHDSPQTLSTAPQRGNRWL